MLPAVEFNDQSLFQANKISDVISNGLLPAKLVAVELPESKLPLKKPFSFCEIFSEGACTRSD